MGFVGVEIINQGRKILKDHIISVTMGNDLNPNNESLINNIKSVVKNKVEYIKIGMFDISMLYMHPHSTDLLGLRQMSWQRT